MHLSILQRLSLKSRVSLFTLAIFLGGLWSLSYYAAHVLREDLEQMLGHQQLATVALVAEEINTELDGRLKALEKVASASGQAMQAGSEAMQTTLDQNLILAGLFNFGVLAYGADGTAIAEVPRSVSRVGLNDMDNATVVAAVNHGKSTISEVQPGMKLQAPVFGMTVPIRNVQGQVIGALSGVIDLGAPGFLDHIVNHHYGKTGGYLLIAPRQRLVVTATDKSRIMEKLPSVGVNPMIDKFLDGHEGSAILVNPHGVEVLVSDMAIPAAGWIAAATLPTEEAFAPIETLLQRLLLVTVTLSLLAGALTWWMLRRQLAPMLTTIQTLAKLSETRQPPQALAIGRQDEIGDLVAGFNGLLQTLAERETALIDSAERYHQLVKDLKVGVLIQSPLAEILMSNQLALDLLGLTEDQLLGKTSFDPSWDVIHEDGSPFPGSTHPVPQAIASKAAVENVVMGVFRPTRQDRVWLLVTAIPQLDAAGSLQQVVCTFSDITQHKHAEAALERSEAFKNTVLNSLKAEIAVVDCRGVIQAVNNGWQQFEVENITVAGKPAPWIGIGTNYLAACNLEARNGIQAVLDGQLPSFSLEYPRDAPRQKRWFSMTVVPLGQDTRNGAVITHTDMTVNKQAILYEHHHNQILELLADDQPLARVLEALVTGVELLQQNTMCSILLLSSDGHRLERGIAPSLPDFYNAALEGIEIGVGVGSCGTAAFTGERVIVEDIATHPYWTPYKELAASAGLGSCWSQPFYAANGQVLGTFAIYHPQAHVPDPSDIALIEQSARLASIAIEKNLALQKLLDSESRFRSMMEDVPSVAVRGHTMDGTVSFWNKAAEKLYGYDTRQAMGANLLDLIIPTEMREGFKQAMVQMVATGQAIPAGELVLKAKDGSAVPVFSSHSMVNPPGGPAELFCLDIDLTERRKMEEQVRQLAFFDPLTMLPNRRLLDDRLKQTMAASARTGHYGALIFLDLDNFKPLNDTHGHEVGDLLLMEVAQRLKVCVREMDTVVRIGGDEFVVMLSELKAERSESTQQAGVIAEKIRLTLAEPYLLTVRHEGLPDEIVEHHCSASLGVALFVNHDSSQADVLKWADAAMYRAKDEGRNRVRFHGEESGAAQ